MTKLVVQAILLKIFNLLTKDRHSYLMQNNPNYKQYSIGRFTYGKPVVMYSKNATLKIGSFCSIASGVRIALGGNHRTDWVTTYPFSVWEGFQHIPGHPATKGDVVIGNDVWIGMDTLILSGVTIGSGAVIGACSVVTKDIPPYCITAGNPARVVKQRFSDEVIKSLLDIKWWDWELSKIKENVPYLLNIDIDNFIRRNSI